MKTRLAEDIRALIKHRDIVKKGMSAAEAAEEALDKKREVSEFLAESRHFRF